MDIFDLVSYVLSVSLFLWVRYVIIRHIHKILKKLLEDYFNF